jgi:sulfur carrier protein
VHQSNGFVIRINGEERPVQSQHLGALVEELGLSGQRIATMVNDEIIRRERRGEFALSPGDRVEIISMVGGG